MSDKNKNESKEFYEGETHYGEFVPSYFAWVSPEKQKEKAKELGDMTNKNKKK